MNILLVEDSGATSSRLAEALDGEHHTVLEAFNINDARAHWDNRETTPIHCIIVDLNMPTDGLTQKQEKESHGGLLTGWLWLRDSVLPHVLAEDRQRVMICSGFVPDFKGLVPAHEYQGIFVVDKRAPSGYAAKVLERVRAIGRLAE